MHDLRRIGGAAALIAAATYIAGFVVFIGLVDAEGYQGISGQLAYATDNQATLTGAMIALYLVFGAALIVLNAALCEGLAADHPGWDRVVGGFGIAWAALVFGSGMVGLAGLSLIGDLATSDPEQAAVLWAALGAVQDGLGGGIEFVGGCWIVLIGWLMLRSYNAQRALAILGIAIGVIGIATMLPQARELAAVFGLAQIIWFIWIGATLLSASKQQPVLRQPEIT